MAYDAGQAFLEIVPAMAGVQAKISAEASKWGVSAGKSFSDSFKRSNDTSGPLGPSKPDSTKQGDASGGAFADGFKRRVEAALKALPEAKIGAETSEADQKIRDLRVRLEELSTKRVGVDIDAGAATAEIAAISAELARLGSESPNIQVKTDTAAAAAKLAEIQAEVDRLDGRNANVDVNVDDHGSAARAASGISGLAAAAAGLGPALIPIGAALVGSMAGLSTAIGAGAGGLGVLALAFHGVGSAIGAVDKANQSAGASAATSAAAQTSAAQQVKAAEESLANARASADSAAIRSAEQVKNARQGLADAERQANQQAITSAEQVQRAEQSLASVVQSVAAARVQAARQVETAERSLTAANQQATTAQKALNDAREQAVRDLEDSANRQADAQLSAQQAALDLTSAQANAATVLASSTSTDLQKQQAVLSVAEAQQRLAEAQQNAQRATEDNTKAQAAGVNGDKGVVSAQAALLAAIQAQKDAQQNLADAVAAQTKQQVAGAQQVAAAQQALADAERQASQQRITSAEQVQRAEQGVADALRNQSEQSRQSAYSIQQAQNGLTSAQNALAAASVKTSTAATGAAAAMAALSPAGQAFVRFVTGTLKPAFDQLTNAAQAGFLPGFQRGLEAMAPLLPSLTRFVGSLASTMGDLAAQAGKALTAPFWLSFFDYVSKTAGPAIRTMAGVVGNLAKGFAGLMMAFAPVSQAMGAGILRLSQGFANLGTHTGPNSPVQQFVAYIRREGPVVADFFGNLFIVIGKLAVALAPFGTAMLGVLAGLTGALAQLSPGQLLAVGEAVAALFVAFKVGLIAVKVATLEEAGAMAVLNAVMDANPIGLVVVALAAFAAGVIYAYEHSKTFRTVVDGIFSWLKTAVVDVIGFVKAHWELIAGILLGPMAIVVIEIVKHWDSIKGAFSAAWTWVTSNWGPKWAAIESVLSAPIRLANDAIAGFIGKIRGVLGDIKDWVVGTFADRWATLQSIMTGPVHAVVGVFQDILGKGGVVRSLFSDAVDAIGGIWDKLKGLIATPVNWVISNVLNKLIGAVNKVSNALGQGDLLSDIPLITIGGKPKSNPSGSTANSVHAASGGVLPGWTPGVDVHHFHSATGGDLHLSGGEAIMRPEWTRAVGGPGAVAAMNAAARRGVYHFASGGIFRPVRGGSPGPIHDEYTGFPAVDVAVPVGSAVAAGAAGRVTSSYDITGYEPRRPGAQDGYRSYGRVIEILHQGFSTLYAHLSHRAAQVGQTVAGGQIIGLSGDTGNSTGPHLHFGAAGISPLAFFGGSTNYTGSAGAGGLPGIPNPADLVGGILGGIGNLFQGAPGGALGMSIAKGLVSTLGDLIKSWAHDKVQALLSLPGKAIGAVGNALGFADGGVFNPHTYDSGGFLSPGMQTVFNGTGKPEPVLTGAQWDAVMGGGRQVIENRLYLSGRELTLEIARYNREITRQMNGTNPMTTTSPAGL